LIAILLSPWQLPICSNCQTTFPSCRPSTLRLRLEFAVTPTRGALLRDVNELTVAVLDLACPDLLDFADDFLGHWHVIKFFGHLVALGVGPGEELESLGRGYWVGWPLGMRMNVAAVIGQDSVPG
jgi:hypothetical protein